MLYIPVSTASQPRAEPPICIDTSHHPPTTERHLLRIFRACWSSRCLCSGQQLFARLRSIVLIVAARVPHPIGVLLLIFVRAAQVRHDQLQLTNKKNHKHSQVSFGSADESSEFLLVFTLHILERYYSSGLLCTTVPRRALPLTMT